MPSWPRRLGRTLRPFGSAIAGVLSARQRCGQRLRNDDARAALGRCRFCGVAVRISPLGARWVASVFVVVLPISTDRHRRSRLTEGLRADGARRVERRGGGVASCRRHERLRDLDPAAGLGCEVARVRPVHITILRPRGRARGWAWRRALGSVCRRTCLCALFGFAPLGAVALGFGQGRSAAQAGASATHRRAVVAGSGGVALRRGLELQGGHGCQRTGASVFGFSGRARTGRRVRAG